MKTIGPCVALSLLFLAQSEKQESMEELLKALAQTDVTVRDKAARAITEQWEEWTDDDLKRLREAAQSPDSEVASRAKEALKSLVRLRRFATHVAVRVEKDGAVRVGDDALKPDAADEVLAKAFAPYAAIPKDPKGKRIFTGVRLFVDADAAVPMGRVQRVLRAAFAGAKVSEVVFLQAGEAKPLALLASRAAEPDDIVDWRDKFLQEASYHYQTQQVRNEEIREQQKTIDELREKVARLERELKERK